MGELPKLYKKLDPMLIKKEYITSHAVCDQDYFSVSYVHRKLQMEQNIK